MRGAGRQRRLLFVLMAFSLFLSLGHYNPLYQFLFQYVPFFNGIRYPAKFLYIFILAVSIAAGLGFQGLIEISKERRNKVLQHLLMFFSLLSGVFLLFSILFHQEVFQALKAWGMDYPDVNQLSVNLYHAKRFLFYVTIFFLLLRAGYEVAWKPWVKVLLLLFLTADLFGNMGFYGKENRSDYFQKTKISEIISSDPGSFRVFSTPKTISMNETILVPNPTGLSFLKERHLPSLNMLHGTHDLWGIDVIRLRRVDDLYRAFTGAPSISATRLLDVYGVTEVVSVTLLEEKPELELIYSHIEGLPGKKDNLLKENTVKLYRHKNPSPRAWLAPDFEVMAQEQVLSTLMTNDFDPRQTVLLEENPLHPTPLPRRGEGKIGGRVQIISESNNRLRVHAETPENGLLVVSDTFFPGWKAFVDGREERILQANYQFRAVALPSGSHQVEFVYDPLSFKLGALGTVLGIAGCLALGWLNRRRSHV
jgi:hypothetical protein